MRKHRDSSFDLVEKGQVLGSGDPGTVSQQ